jgi:flagellin-like protein
MTVLRIKLRRRRAAISEILGSLIMIAITLVAGTAVFGFVNGQSGTSAQQVGKSAADNINFLNEREVVVYAAMSSPSSAQLWVYNNGAINPETIKSILVRNATSTSSDSVCEIATSANVNKSQVQSITVDLSLGTLPDGTTICTQGTNALTFKSLSSYTFVVTGLYGSTAQLTVRF